MKDLDYENSADLSNDILYKKSATMTNDGILYGRLYRINITMTYKLDGVLIARTYGSMWWDVYLPVKKGQVLTVGGEGLDPNSVLRLIPYAN